MSILNIASTTGYNLNALAGQNLRDIRHKLMASPESSHLTEAVQGDDHALKGMRRRHGVEAAGTRDLLCQVGLRRFRGLFPGDALQ